MKRSAANPACVALLSLFCVLAVGSSLRKSATFDEVHYQGVGKHILRNRAFTLRNASFHPPLFFYLSSVTQWGLDWPAQWDRINYKERGWRIASMLPHDRVIQHARMPFILLGALLGLLLYLWARELFGPGPALFSLALFALSPNILAHARLVTADILLALTYFLTFFLAWRVRRRGLHVRRTCALALALAATLLSKYTGILAVPALAAVFAADRRVWRRATWSRTMARRAAGHLLLAIVLTGAVVWAHYFFHMDVPRYADSETLKSLRSIAPFTEWLMRLPAPCPEYLEGLSWQFRDSEQHRLYMHGRILARSPWFFLYAMSVKVPAVSLLAFAAGVVAFLRNPRTRGDAAAVLTPAAFFLLAMSLSGAAKGLRYCLPVFPFLFLAAGAGMHALSPAHPWVRRTVTAGILIAAGVANASIYPHYLAYFNVFAGGPRNGHHHLVDSNLDWGQDLKGLADDLRRRGERCVRLAYFGLARPEYYGIDWTPLHPRKEQTGLCAISVTRYQRLYERDPEAFAWLRRYDPIDSVGYSILLFRVPKDHD